jgi:hypothetical protein
MVSAAHVLTAEGEGDLAPRASRSAVVVASMRLVETCPVASRAVEVSARRLRRSQPASFEAAAEVSAHPPRRNRPVSSEVAAEVTARRPLRSVSSEAEVVADSAHRVRRKVAASPAATEVLPEATATVVVATPMAGAAIMAAAS